MNHETDETMDLPVLKDVPRFGIRILCVLTSVATCIAWVACSNENELPYYNTPDFTPYWESSSSFSVDTLHTIAPFTFVDQEGRNVSDKTFKDKVYVASFFFTICPGICPKLTGNMSKVADTFKDNAEVLFISHSVTPDIDSVSQLKYAELHGIRSSQWHLVTGSRDAIYSLARQSYFAEQEIGFQLSSQEFLHTEHFILIDREGHIRGIYKGTLDLEAKRLIDDIHVLLD